MILKNDTVLVLTGKDKGKQGQVTKVLAKKDKVLVVGINVAKKHLKPSRKSPHGGIVDMPTPIWASNVMVVCPHCGKPVKPAVKITAKSKERICRKCKSSLNVKESNAKA